MARARIPIRTVPIHSAVHRNRASPPLVGAGRAMANLLGPNLRVEFHSGRGRGPNPHSSVGRKHDGRVGDMRILVIGGTRFVGRAFVQAATERGHEVTVFHRGSSEPEGPTDVEHVHGDRDGGLDVLAQRSWDAALDTCGYLPRVVRDSAQFLLDAVGHYSFVSTLSVYGDELPPGA